MTRTRRVLALLVLPATALAAVGIAEAASPQPRVVASTCNGVAVTIFGTDGNDVITGTPGNDVISGGDGDDVLIGNGGLDRLCGGAGDDTLVMGVHSGTAYESGDAGNDRLYGSPTGAPTNCFTGEAYYFCANQTGATTTTSTSTTIAATTTTAADTTTTTIAASTTTTQPATSTTASPASTTTAPTTSTSSPTTSTSTTIPASSAFPDSTNTGYLHSPDCPSGVTPFSGTIQSNQTYACKQFPGANVGSATAPVVNVTFKGCLFKSASVEGALVLLYGDNITFSYSTFQPNVAAPPVAYSQSYQYGIEADGSYNSHVGKLTVDHSDIWGFGNAIDVAGSTQTKPQVFTNNYIHDASADGGSYHTDGIGTLSGSGTGSYVVLDHNTISSAGNTNGVAFQAGRYDHYTITNNLFSGFGYTVALLGGATNTTFTGNTFSTKLKPVWGPLYPSDFWSTAGSLWRNNRWLVPAGAAWGSPSNSGKFWVPNPSSGTSSDNAYVSSTDYTG